MGGAPLGVILPNYGEALEREALAGTALAAEEVGFDSGWVTDHLVVPEELRRGARHDRVPRRAD